MMLEWITLWFHTLLRQNQLLYASAGDQEANPTPTNSNDLAEKFNVQTTDWQSSVVELTHIWIENKQGDMQRSDNE